MSGDGRFARLTATQTFAGDAHERWRASKIALVGAGAVGGQLAPEVARSGARVRIYDFDRGSEENLGTQEVIVGRPKAEVLADRCNRIASGSATARCVDVRHEGVGAFEDVALIVDCSDDPALEHPLTRISNGLQVPLVRIAVDGTGERELGRVLVSHGGAGHPCQLCASSADQVHRPGQAIPCRGRAATPGPTNAGSALAMAVAGLGLVYAQRIVGGNRATEIFGRETFVDLGAPAILPMRLERNESCVSGHACFAPTRLDEGARDCTVGELFVRMSDPLSDESAPDAGLTLEPFGHPLLLELACDCGEGLVHPGTPWQDTPPCPGCGAAMERRHDVVLDRFDYRQARLLGILDRTWAELGLPESGALVIARDRDRSPTEFLLA